VIGFSDAVVCIVGLGLMGASAAQRIHGQCRKLIGVDRNTESLQTVLAQGWVDSGFNKLQDLDEAPDLVILCTPVRTILSILENDLLTIKTPSVIVDFGSTKGEIIQKMAALPERFTCFACHPMAGRETSGPQSSVPDLYLGRPFLFYPIVKESRGWNLLADLIKALGATPVRLDPENHDMQLATISHVPYLMAVALSLVSAQDGPEASEALWEIAANGYHDMTRLAGSDLNMMTDILATNPQNISVVLQKVIDQLAEIKTMVDNQQPEKIMNLLAEAKQIKKRANQCRKS
jgi:prephenate dehydrogenase